MNELPLPGAGGGATASLGRVAVGGFWRVVVAGGVLVIAAVVITMSGGAGFGGSVGALFGLHTGQGGKPATAIQVAAPAPVLHPDVVARVTPRHHARSAPVRPRSRKPAATGPQHAPAPSTQPAPSSPVPTPAPIVPKPPPPAPSGNVEQLARAVHDTVAPAAPAPSQPVLDQTVAVVNQACGLIGGCP